MKRHLEQPIPSGGELHPTRATSAPRAGAPKALIIDDEETFRAALGRALKRLGFEISAMADPSAGLLAIPATVPDVVFVDLRMPLIDGHAFMRRLNATVLEQRPGIIVMSGNGNMDDVIEALRLGAVDYLRKPWNLTELAEATNRAMAAHGRPKARVNLGATDPPSALSNDCSPASRFRDLPQRLRRGEVVLPATPSALLRLRELVDSPDSSIDEITTVIEQDPRLAVDLLRVANSALYARLGKAQNVRAAVTRLGLRHIHNLAQTISLQGFCEVGQSPYRRTLGIIWQRSVARAVSMRALCDLLGPQQALDGDTAYLIGLMSDVGASLLLWMASERASERSMKYLQIASQASEHQAVMEIVRRNHEGLSAALVESWKFETLVGVCTARHHLDTAPPTHPLWWSLQVLGEHLASRILSEPDVTSDRPRDELTVERSALALCIPRSVVDHLVERLGEEMAAIRGDEVRA